MNVWRTIGLGFPCLLVFLLVSTLPVTAQNSRGTILGHVQDTSGAAMPGVKVTVENTSTGVRNQFRTTGPGDFVFVDLVPGTYNITVERDGFKTETSAGLILEVDQTLRENFTLQVGTVSETVTVGAETQMLQTDNTTTGNVVDERLIDGLPSNGRDFTNLLNLNAGATNLSGGIQATGFVLHGLSGFTEVSLNGARPDSISYLVDGVTDNDSFFSGASNVPSLFSIQEVKMENGLYSAEYGQGSGQVNVAIKSGTNQWHGQAYDFIQNDAFAPKNRLQAIVNADIPSLAGPLKTRLRQNQFGGTLGGPVTIPLLYHGQNKSFWFFAYDGGRRTTLPTSASTSPLQIPTAKERNGDFSDWPFPIYDPATRGSQPVTAANPLGETAFPSNQIPSQRISSIGQKIVNLYPTPNITCTLPCANFVNPQLTSVTTNNETFRVDQYFGQKDRLYFTGHIRRDNEPNPSQLPLSGSVAFTNSSLFGWNWQHTFGLNTVNEARFGINRQAFSSNGDGAFGPNLSQQLGFQNSPTNPAEFGIPLIALGQGYANIGVGGGGAFTGTTHHVYQWVDNLKLIRGRHTFTLGTDIRLNHELEADDFLGTGQLNFNGSYTALDPSTSNGSAGPSTGNPVADVLLGFPRGLSAPQPLGTDLVHATGRSYSFFAQDDFRVTSRLTLNLGLRYEIPPDYHSDNGGGWALDPSNGGGYIWVSKSFVQSITTPQTNPNFLRCCVQGTLVPIDKHDFAPRVGVAWRPLNSDRFVVRAGYGIFYDTYNRYYDLIQNFDDPQILSVIANPNYPQPTGTETASPLALKTLFLPPVSSSQFFTFQNWDSNAILASGVLNQVNNPSNHNPYNQQWTLDTQYALNQNLLLDIGYVGSHGIHLPTQLALNAARLPADPSDSCNGGNVGNNGGPYFDRNQPGVPAACLADPNFSPIDTRVPYPNIPSDVYANANFLTASYNALQAQLRQRFSHGFEYQVFYTYSKTLDENSGINNINGVSAFIQDPHNIRNDYGPASFDQTHRLVGSGLWEVPVGKGQRWSVGPANWILGGWRISGIYTVASGRTATVYAPVPTGAGGFDETGSNLTNRYRANLVGNPNSGFSQGYTEWFNPAAFATPSAGAYGTAGKGIIRGPYIENLDLSFQKQFAFTERHRLQYRLEIFNVGSNWRSGGVIPNTSFSTSPNNNFGFLGTNWAQFPGGAAINNLPLHILLWNPRVLQMSLIYSF